MQFEYTPAEAEDLDRVLGIYVGAQKFMEEHGNPQWGKGFPDRMDILGGILGGIIYKVTCGGEIAAVFSVVNHDGNYDNIDGAWLTNGNYLAVHRVAVSETFRGTGAAKFIVNIAANEIALSRGRGSIRMDTHAKNAPMLALLRSQGFTECGQISLTRDDTVRTAFERLVTPRADD